MSLFVNTYHHINHHIDHNATNVSETIEYDCLSVLHKLHDQVNGPQLVQVVVQPLARLFNPTAAALNNAAVAPPSVNNKNATDNNTLSSNSTNLIPTSTTNTSPSIQQSLNLANPSQGPSLHVIHNSNPHIGRGSLSLPATSTSNSTYMMSPDTVQALIARLDTDRDINWLMEIIGYGLSMPFSVTSEQDSVKDCCTIYLEWLSAALLPLTDEQNDNSRIRQLVPVPIRNDPNRYARKMLSHLYNVFLPRQPIHINASLSSASINNVNIQKDNHNDRELAALSRQAVLCHRVLRTLENIAQNPTNLMDNETWDHLLALLLTVNNKLLAQPTQSPDIGSQLQERILGVLFDLILLASCKSIPMHNVWKTFHTMCLSWRHRSALIDHWRRVTLLLTKRIIRMPNTCQNTTRVSSTLNRSSIVSIDNSSFTIGIETAISTMSYDSLSQTWYRFLNLIGNPVDLTNPHIISKTNEFYDYACASENVMDPSQHPCLNVLPIMFNNSMLALRDFVDTFIGTYEESLDDFSTEIYGVERQSNRASITSISSTITPTSIVTSNNQPQQQASTTPTQARKVIKSITMKGNKVVNPFTSPSQHQQSDLSDGKNDSQSFSRNLSQIMEPRSSISTLSARTLVVNQQPIFKLSPDRPKINSILHLFGDWLFSAALIGSDLKDEVSGSSQDMMNIDAHDDLSVSGIDNSSLATGTSDNFIQTGPRTQSKTSYSLISTSSTKNLNQQQQQYQNSQESIRNLLDSHDQRENDKICPNSWKNYEDGQAEAITILCRIFSSKTSSEDVSPNYLSRFYLCLQHCLSLTRKDNLETTPIKVNKSSPDNNHDSVIRRHLLASVLINSTNLLQKDLDGINLLIPSFITAIEYFFECSERDFPVQPPPRSHQKMASTNRPNPLQLSTGNSNNFSTNELRRACIQTLINLLAYPYHFQNLAIRNCLNDNSPAPTFGSLRPKLIKLLFIALQTESDPINMQILFGGLSLAIYDLASNATKSSNNKNSTSQKDEQYLRTVNGTRFRSNSSSTHACESLHSFDGSTGLSTQGQKSTSNNDETCSQTSFIGSSPGAFLIKSVHVTSHLLINTWKNDTQVSLAALDLLTMIARVTANPRLIDYNESDRSPDASLRLSSNNNINNNNQVEMRNEYNQATKWICDYICSQCSRPPPAHSRDMHSTIVAAYQCLSIWISNHPYLLEERNCVNTLMEVIELGVSGQKSKSISYEPNNGTEITNIVVKGDKILKPSSMRVKEAAEFLLNICMIRSRLSVLGDPFDLSYDSVLNEQGIIDMFGDPKIKNELSQLCFDDDSRRLQTNKYFKYFSDEDSILYGFFENIATNETISKDSVICLLRTPFGRYCYKLKFNCYPEQLKEKMDVNRNMGPITRPFNYPDEGSTGSSPNFDQYCMSLYFNKKARFFPESIENTPPSELDLLVDTLEDYFRFEKGKTACSQYLNSNLRSDLDNISKIFHDQVQAEQDINGDKSEIARQNQPMKCFEPQISDDFCASRMLAIQLGLETCLPVCERTTNNFINELETLDLQSIKMCDRASIFYIRKNRTSIKDILESVKERRNISLEFFEWLLELGRPLLVKNHSRWTGRLSTSYKSRSLNNNDTINNNNNDNKSLGALSSGSNNTQPSLIQMLNSDHGGSMFDGERLTLYWSDMCQELAFLVPHQLDDYDQQLQNQQIQQQLHQTNSVDIIICWLESGDDIFDIPSDILLSVARHGLMVPDMSTASDFSKRDTTSSSANTSPGNCSMSQIEQQQRGSPSSLNQLTYNTQNQSQPQQQPQRLRTRDYAKFYITPMKNGLYRVNLQTSFGRQNLALPLVDGMTVSQGTLSSLIRESILNFCRRRRLDADAFQPAHVRRRQKIQKICNTYKVSSQSHASQYYDNLFHG